MKTQVNQHGYHLGIVKVLIISSFILLAFGVYKVFKVNETTQEFVYENSMEGNMPPSFHSGVSDMLYTHSFSNEVKEEALAVESWMLSSKGWVVDHPAHVSFFEEDELSLEGWMMELADWNVPIISRDKLAALEWGEEEPLVLVSWMMSCCTWVPDKFGEINIEEFSNSFKENALALEDWMLDDNSWLIVDHSLVGDYPRT
ncbi:hypothetical protein [Saccharicrinis fermentans]|uniref:Uncharacterized protein n=1 Tax=Saccharicrinis fermentans DSM 9555 = JCM 21142 TaxID=869213 RepID=W7Y1J6_9BACT|nr:hypothetical protein [Saccharicrinis fermentans]GAF04770.1 hypothetical protein JCM21142_93487 [Saccharicrinis fermentans DSM 9555 = JCM 21142]